MLEPVRGLEVEQDRLEIRLVKPVDFTRCVLRLRRVAGDEGELDIREEGFPPHCLVLAGPGLLVREVSFVFHRNHLDLLTDDQLVCVELKDLVARSVVRATDFVAVVLAGDEGVEAVWKGTNVTS